MGTLVTKDPLRFTERRGEVCPASWQPGREGMTPTTDRVAEYLAKHMVARP